MIKRIVITLLVAGGLWACTDKEKEEKDSLMSQVMAAHDEVMPKMGDLRRLNKTLTEKADSLATLPDSTTYADQIVRLRATADRIETANESMMEWMRQFEVPDNEAPVQEVLVYLKEQKAKIDKVREDMLKAMEEGQQLK